MASLRAKASRARRTSPVRSIARYDMGAMEQDTGVVAALRAQGVS